MRDLITVIEQIQAEIPGGNTHALWAALERQKMSQRYRAPEVMVGWHLVAEDLNTYLGQPDTDWKKRIQDIFADRIPK